MLIIPEIQLQDGKVITRAAVEGENEFGFLVSCFGAKHTIAQDDRPRIAGP